MAPLIQGFHRGYERNGIYTTEAVFAQLGNSWAVFDGDIIPVVSLRYQVFVRSRVCVCCGLVGTYFAKERSARKVKTNGADGEVFFHFKPTSSTWHFNLYATTPDGREVLMTKDHIRPRSKGGPDHMDNLQTMCSPCNCKKRDRLVYQSVLPFGGSITITV